MELTHESARYDSTEGEAEHGAQGTILDFEVTYAIISSAYFCRQRIRDCATWIDRLRFRRKVGGRGFVGHLVSFGNSMGYRRTVRDCVATVRADLFAFLLVRAISAIVQIVTQALRRLHASLA